jgi:hypothetical protein
MGVHNRRQTLLPGVCKRADQGVRTKLGINREVATTVRLKLHSLTNVKERLLRREYDAFQDAVQGDSEADLCSATEQQARKVRKQKNPATSTNSLSRSRLARSPNKSMRITTRHVVVSLDQPNRETSTAGRSAIRSSGVSLGRKGIQTDE